MKVLWMVNGEKKSVVGYIYEAMDRANETILRVSNKGGALQRGLWARR